MGILSSTASMVRYKVLGELETPVIETVYNGLVEYAITEIEDDYSEKTIGWTSFFTPYQPDFEGSSFVFDNYFIFSFRIDKKSIPKNVVKKIYQQEMVKKLAESGKDFLSSNEKSMLKENITNMLCKKIPANPNVYDIIWNYEEKIMWFFSTLKAANEELETLFATTFNINLFRLFPYSTADLQFDLTQGQKDTLNQLSPTNFME